MKINSMFLADGYKVGHFEMYQEGTEVVYSNFTPRSNKYAPKGNNGKVLNFGHQYAIRFIVEHFNENFFSAEKEIVIEDVKKNFSAYLGVDYDTKHIEELYDLGYLPLEIRTLDEGTESAVKIPVLFLYNTDIRFAWVTNYIETILSNLLWQPLTTATNVLLMKRIVKEAVLKTDKDNVGAVDFMLHDFSMRGLTGLDAAIGSGLAFASVSMGSDSLPVIKASQHYYDETSTPVFSVRACFPDGAEILTENGFLDFRELEYTDKVAQYKKDGTIEFVHPNKIYEYDFDGELIDFKGGKEGQIHITVTPEHRLPYINDRGNFNIKTAQEMVNKPKFILSGEVGDTGNNLSDYERLLIAFQADGSFSTRDEEYTGKRTDTRPMRFPTLKKERKQKRLEEILEKLDFDYTKSNYEKGASYRISVPYTNTMSKTFDWVKLDNVSIGWCKSFIEELQYWDGNSNRKEIINYSSTIKENVDIVQAIAALCGMKTHYRLYNDKRVNRQPLHCLTIGLSTKIFNLNEDLEKSTITYKGKVRCVNVNSGMFICRQYNRVMVTGNSEHSQMTAGGIEGEFEIYKNLLTKFPNGIMSLVSDSFDLWRVLTDYLPKLKDIIIARDGKLVIRPDSGNPVDIICGENIMSLMGRKIQPALTGSPENKGVIELLWNVFGGTINEQGFKVLDSHIGMIYGEAINQDNIKEIFQRLEDKGFAASNCFFGQGSFSMQMVTRDTWGMALKCIAQQRNGELVEIMKDPVTDDGIKKSAKGLTVVFKNEDGEYYLKDQASIEEVLSEKNQLRVRFRDGKYHNQTTLTEIRQRINGNN